VDQAVCVIAARYGVLMRSRAVLYGINPIRFGLPLARRA
jgi:hypothetical protein